MCVSVCLISVLYVQLIWMCWLFQAHLLLVHISRHLYWLKSAVRAGVCVPQCCTTVLVVRDVSSPAEVKIYMNVRGCQYPLGLLPGTTVHFERLQLRRTSSIGAPYFVYSLASSCHVVKLAGTTDRDAVHCRYSSNTWDSFSTDVVVAGVICTPRWAGYPLSAFAPPLSIHFLIFCSLLLFPFFLFSFTLLIFFYCPSDPFLPESFHFVSRR